MASGPRGRRYSDEFKSDVVALVRRSGRPIAHIAKELGCRSRSRPSSA